MNVDMSPEVCDLRAFIFAWEWLRFVSVFGFFVCVLAGAARCFPLGVCSNIDPCVIAGSVGDAAGMLCQLVLVAESHFAPRTRVHTSLVSQSF